MLITNQWGYPQEVADNGGLTCPSCNGPAAENRGQGIICDACDNAAALHFAHDYDTIDGHPVGI